MSSARMPDWLSSAASESVPYSANSLYVLTQSPATRQGKLAVFPVKVFTNKGGLESRLIHIVCLHDAREV